jgi:hypothetical protein
MAMEGSSNLKLQLTTPSDKNIELNMNTDYEFADD